MSLTELGFSLQDARAYADIIVHLQAWLSITHSHELFLYPLDNVPKTELRFHE